jgi:outer membrane lipoprotein SlyB
MKLRNLLFGLFFGTALTLSLPVGASDNLTRDAAIGGGVGGALGGALGAEVGGREGAIIGAGVGAAVGTAIATDDHGDGHNDHDLVDGLEVHARIGDSGHPVGHDRGRHCPPGQAKKGRC